MQDLACFRQDASGIAAEGAQDPVVGDEPLTVIITAGGLGLRLWPLSTPERPKPFCRLFDEKTLLEHSFRLACAFTTPKHIFVVTSRRHFELLQNNLPDLPMGNFIPEPATRGTTAAIGLATLQVAKLYPQSVCVVLSSDHYVPDVAQFCHAIRCAASAARTSDTLVSIGVTPTFPHTGYGYMECGPEWRKGTGVRIGLSYHEKPDNKTAWRYLKEKRWLWNTNVFVWSIPTILKAFARYTSSHFEQIKAAHQLISDRKYRCARRVFKRITTRSIDYEIMEKIKTGSPFQHLFVAYDGQWSDVGTFTSLRPLLRRPDTNSVLGCVTTKNVFNCLLICEHPFSLAAHELRNLDVVVNYRGDLYVKYSQHSKDFQSPATSGSHSRGACANLKTGMAYSSIVAQDDHRGVIFLNRVSDVDIRIDDFKISIARMRSSKGKRTSIGSNAVDLRIFPDARLTTQHAAQLVVDNLRHSLSIKERAVFVPSVGRTTADLFKSLYLNYRDSIDWSRIVVVQMDEYLGVSSDDPQSFAFRLQNELVSPLGITEFASINGSTGRLKQLPKQYEGGIKQLGGIDVILHGIGRNGHLGFNEPGTSFGDRFGFRKLCPETQEANFGVGPRPQGFNGIGVSLGLSFMAKARCAILLALGPEKRIAIRRTLSELPTPDVPATILKLHRNSTFVVDRTAYFASSKSESSAQPMLHHHGFRFTEHLIPVQ